MLIDLLNIYPNSYSIFVDRAINRRVEFRRIRKQYEKFANVNPDPVLDAKNTQDPAKFTIKSYNDQSREEDQPPYLIDPDFYFTKVNMINIPNSVCENISDSERTVLEISENNKVKT